VPQWLADLAGVVRERGDTGDGDFDPMYSEAEFEALLNLIPVERYDNDHDAWLELMLACTHASTTDDGKNAFMAWTTKDGPGERIGYGSDYEMISARWDYNFQKRNMGGKSIQVGTFNKHVADAGFADRVKNKWDSEAADDFLSDPLDEADLAALSKLSITRDRVTYEDFVFSLPDNEFIFIPSGANKLWPSASVNRTCVGPMIVDPVLAREFETHEAAKAFAKSDEGWTDAEPANKSKRPKRTKAESVVMRDRFASGLDIDFGFDEKDKATSDKQQSEATPPPPPKSEARQRIDRLTLLMETTPQILRAWLLKNGIFMPNNSWSEVVRISATDAVVGDKGRHVAEISWWPGKPSVLRDLLIRNEGGVIPIRGTNTFNRYRPALLKRGKFPPPTRWLDHVKLIYPDDAQHIIQWFAWRTQRPDVKILHALILGGATRIGKDTLVHPLGHAIGSWNFKTTTAQYIMDEPKNNDYLEAMVCLVSEAKDFGQEDRYAFYERMKPWLGGTAKDVVMVADKYIRVHPVMDVWGAIITTNFKVRGLYLPDDDERHYAAWSNRTWEDWGFATREELSEKYFKPLHDWYSNGGNDAVAHYLMNLPLDEAFPKAPPPKTAAWYEIVNAYANPDKSKLMDILDGLGNPPAVTVNEVGKAGKDVLDWFGASERNTVPAQFEDAGYSHQSNPTTKNGKWLVGTKRRAVTIYVKSKLTSDERVAAANEVYARVRKAVAAWEADPANTVDPLG
jgi:hypothetical protein